MVDPFSQSWLQLIKFNFPSPSEAIRIIPLILCLWSYPWSQISQQGHFFSYYHHWVIMLSNTTNYGSVSKPRSIRVSTTLSAFLRLFQALNMVAVLNPTCKIFITDFGFQIKWQLFCVASLAATSTGCLSFLPVFEWLRLQFCWTNAWARWWRDPLQSVLRLHNFSNKSFNSPASKMAR